MANIYNLANGTIRNIIVNTSEMKKIKAHSHDVLHTNWSYNQKGTLGILRHKNNETDSRIALQYFYILLCCLAGLYLRSLGNCYVASIYKLVS